MAKVVIELTDDPSAPGGVRAEVTQDGPVRAPGPTAAQLYGAVVMDAILRRRWEDGLVPDPAQKVFEFKSYADFPAAEALARLCDDIGMRRPPPPPTAVATAYSRVKSLPPPAFDEVVLVAKKLTVGVPLPDDCPDDDVKPSAVVEGK
jgi:hypothetical protein